MAGKIVDGGAAQISETTRPTSRTCCGDVAYEVGKNTAAATNAFDRVETPRAMNYFNNKARKEAAPAPFPRQVTADDIEANKGGFCGVGAAEYDIGRNTADATNVFEKHEATAAQKHFQRKAPTPSGAAFSARLRRFLTKNE